MLPGYRRYFIALIGFLTAGYAVFFGEPLDQEAVTQIVADVGSALTAVLALWSAVAPAPAAGTNPTGP